LAVVFTGLAGGDMVLPVRLPQGAGQWGHQCHFLADPGVWHKIDLVRVRDRKAPGGWRYYAHLLTHQPGYQSPGTLARRAEIPTHRRAGVDANVSNLAIASFPDEHPEQLVAEQITCDAEQQQAAARAARNTCARQKALDRSRRNTNPKRYSPSARQQKRAQRRVMKGLAAKQVTNPGGARHARGDGVPLRAYRHDRLSGGYQRIRADHATQARSASQAKHARARDVGAHRRQPRQYHHRRGLFDHDLGAPVGQADRPVQPRHAGGRPQTRMSSHRRHAVSRRHPIHRAEPALPVRGAGAQDPGPAHP
jgi:hypothetical protein